MAGCCCLLYAIVGAWLVKSAGYIGFESVSRTVSAQSMLHSRDPHLGAIGFVWPPIPTLVRIPFVLLLAPLGQTILAGAFSSSVAVAMTVPVLVKVGDELGLRLQTTRLFVLLFALNPITVFIAANGTSDALVVLVVATTCLGYVRYTRTGTVESIALIGLSLGVGLASRIEFIPLTAAVMIACALNTSRDRARRVALLVGLPPAMVFVVWSVASRLQAGSLFSWLTNDQVAPSTPSIHPWLPSTLSTHAIVGHVVSMTFVLAPALVVALVMAARQRGERQAWLGLTVIVATLPLLLVVQLLLRDTVGSPRVLTPLLACSAVASMWVVARDRASAHEARSVLVIALALMSVVGGGAATVRFADHDHREADGDVGDLSHYVDLRNDLDPLLGSGRFVAMDSVQAVPLLETRHPRQFVISDDRDFEEVLSDAAGRFDFILIQPGSPATAASELLNGELARSDGGRWTQVGDYGGLVLVYEWMDDGAQPMFVQRDADATP